MRLQSHHLELLSPARDASIAREAILHGADAVYIGGPGFGARHNASNSLSDIAELVPFAHRFGAKVFVTLNTILHDDELEPAQRLITDLYQTGVDALIGDKLFTGPLAAGDNWCTLLRHSVGLRLRVEFDAEATPYLGLWLCYGGWPERPGPTQVCVAMEPSTAPCDSLAVTGPWSRTLAPGESFSWSMQLEIERL